MTEIIGLLPGKTTSKKSPCALSGLLPGQEKDPPDYSQEFRDLLGLDPEKDNVYRTGTKAHPPIQYSFAFKK